jgi:putative protein-disulfide isomerase
MWELGAGLRFRWVMGGLAREYGSGADVVAEQMGRWLEVAAETGMPTDPLAWREGPLASTYPACLAVKAAAEQGDEPGYAYLRRLREGILVERRKLDHTEALVGAAREAGLDVARFRIDLGSNAITEAFAADLDEVRDVPGQARAEGESKDTERGERLALPSFVFVGTDGERHGVWGPRPYDAYRDAALAAGAPPADGERPEPLDALARFGRAATREIEEVTGRPRIPLEAELWSLAREWRVRPTPVLGGTLWEPA